MSPRSVVQQQAYQHVGNKLSAQKGESVANNGSAVLLKPSGELEFRDSASCGYFR
jgi:hypothetical protein